MTEAAIAREEKTDVPGSEDVQATQYLTFRIASETYAISVLRVKEILRFETITAVPSTPRSIRGVINLRGSVVPVVDLAVKFGLPESEITKWSCIVIVEADLDGEETVMGVMADAVSQVVQFLPRDIEPPPPFGTKVKTDYLVGMGREEKRFVLILDIDQVLTAEELTTASGLASDEEATAEEREPAQGPRESGAAPPHAGRAGTDRPPKAEKRRSKARAARSAGKTEAAVEPEAEEFPGAKAERKSP